MNERDALERRVSALIEAYANRAPIDVDPKAMTRLVAAGSQRTSPVWVPFVLGRGLAFKIVILALLVTIATGALVAGAQLFRRDPVEILTDRAYVEPFVGFPPEGAAPSTPEQGELVLSFGGRVNMLGLDFHRMWLYADGRLIWKSNLEGSSAGWRRRFGASEPTTAVIEQHLTPEGIELMRSRVMAAGLHDLEPFGTTTYPGPRGRPGALWGRLAVRDGERLVEADWSDSQLPGLLADPASWIPASAWEDRRIGAYVPSRYAVCLGQALPAGATGLAPTDLWDLLPEPTRNLIRSKALEDPAPDWDEQDARCLYQVSTDDARAIVAPFDDGGIHPQPGFAFPIGAFQIGHEFSGIVELLVVLPNGEVVCHCG